MSSDFKGRFATYYRGDWTTRRVDFTSRISLNAIKVNCGTDIARELLTKKRYRFSNERWYELELLPGEKKEGNHEKTNVVYYSL